MVLNDDLYCFVICILEPKSPITILLPPGTGISCAFIKSPYTSLLIGVHEITTIIIRIEEPVCFQITLCIKNSAIIVLRCVCSTSACTAYLSSNKGSSSFLLALFWVCFILTALANGPDLIWLIIGIT